jgi:hypothetical protein
MIALCADHHLKADAGTFSPEQLKSFKHSPNSAGFVRTKFEWSLDRCLIRLGGCYAPEWCSIILGQDKVLEVLRDTTGHNSINMLLRDEHGTPIATMERSVFRCDVNAVNDLSISASGTRLTIWSSPRNVGFECHYARLARSEIEALISKDLPPLPDDCPPPTPIQDLDAFYAELSRITDLMHIASIGQQRRDIVGTLIRWQAARMMGSDGCVPVLDFIRCSFYDGQGRSLVLKNGRLGALEFCAGNTFRFG